LEQARGAGFETSRGKHLLQVLVRDNNVDQALKVLKRKMQREGVFREMKRRRFYEKPSEKTAREKSEAIRRARKLARKRAQREGLIAAPAKRDPVSGRPADSTNRRQIVDDETKGEIMRCQREHERRP